MAVFLGPAVALVPGSPDATGLRAGHEALHSLAAPPPATFWNISSQGHGLERRQTETSRTWAHQDRQLTFMVGSWQSSVLNSGWVCQVDPLPPSGEPL